VIVINSVNYEFVAEAPAFHLSFHIREDSYRQGIGVYSQFFEKLLNFTNYNHGDTRSFTEFWL
jgi:hypothetical protein